MKDFCVKNLAVAMDVGTTCVIFLFLRTLTSFLSESEVTSVLASSVLGMGFQE